MKHTTEHEVWKDIEGYEGMYQASSLGRVRSLDRVAANGRQIKGVVLRPAPNSKGYLCVSLHNNGDGGRSHLVHRLVAEAFRPGHDKPHINHRNADKRDNQLTNLEWVTPLENARHARASGLIPLGEQNGRAKLRADDVLQIRALYSAGFRKEEIAEQFGISPIYVYQLAHRCCWKHL